MDMLVWSLIIVPWVGALALLGAPRALARMIAIASAALVAGVAIVLAAKFPWQSAQSSIRLELPAWLDAGHTIADFAVLVLFGAIGVSEKHRGVMALTALQIALVGLLTYAAPHGHASSVMLIDRLAIVMCLLINVVSAMIVVFATQYAEDEDVSPARRRQLIGTLLGFVGVMNFVVLVDELKWFFVLFEVTTLASWVLIRFRLDPESRGNALRAVWMNQIGGVAIIGALFAADHMDGLHTTSLSALVERAALSHQLLPIALLAVAGMIKGAQLPFSGWLLGAMVAPTPVSALLHSSTMVKLAPYIILRLSPALHGTNLGAAITLTSAVVFVASALASLAKDQFKSILAHSTIALLGLMILLSSIGTQTATVAALVLVVFHGVSKALLFLAAGIMEKVHHLKHVAQIPAGHAHVDGVGDGSHGSHGGAHQEPSARSLGEVGPVSSFFVTIGLLSLMLPPFGAFFGKWLAIETLTNRDPYRPAYLVALLCVVLGSALLSLLYLKVIGFLVMKGGNAERPARESLPFGYLVPTTILSLGVIIGAAAFGPLVKSFFGPTAATIVAGKAAISLAPEGLMVDHTHLPAWLMAASLLLLPTAVLLARSLHLRGVDRAAEYACGQREELEFAPPQFSFDRWTGWLSAVSALGFVLIVLAGGLFS